MHVVGSCLVLDMDDLGVLIKDRSIDRIPTAPVPFGGTIEREGMGLLLTFVTEPMDKPFPLVDGEHTAVVMSLYKRAC